MRIRIGIYTFIFLFICLTNSYTQEITFKNLTTYDGLSNNAVLSSFQDERGFIWFGTRNGLNLYNGNEFVVYKYRKDMPNSIPTNGILQICGNHRGEIYCMTSQGLSIFNISRNKFTTLVQRTVDAIFYHKALFVAIGNSIYQYTDGHLALIYRLPNSNAKIKVIDVDEKQTFIGTEEHGLFVLDKSGNLQHLITNGTINSIFKETAQKYWIGTKETGLYLIENSSVINYQHHPKKTGSLSSNFVRCCCLDKNGRLWVGTFNGLDVFDATTQTFYTYTKTNTKEGLTHSSIWSLLCDHQGTMWVGTFFGGVNYFNTGNQIYQQYKQSEIEAQGLSSSIVGRMAEDKDRNLWICTEGGGLNRLNLKTREFRWYKPENSEISQSNLNAIYYDKQREVLWLGIHLGGLNKFDIRTGKFSRYDIVTGDEKAKLPNIKDIVAYKNSLILATNKGVYLFNPETGESTRMFQKNINIISSTSNLFIDHRNILWICGTENGIYTYNFDTDKITNYKQDPTTKNGISSNSINCIFEDSQKRIWFCTNESGIDLYNSQTDSFENFDMEYLGLGSNTVYGACELSPNRILFAIDNGFSILDFTTRRFKNYHHKNGLPLSTVNEHALYKTCDGEVFIGGVQEGMISFYDKDIDYKQKNYKILPFQLIVNGKEIKVNDDTGILPKALTETSKITLKAGVSMLSIEYAISNYVSPQNELEYCLEGFSDSWNSTRDQHTITYTNLAPGQYTLIVRTPKDSPDTVNESRLEIDILAPFYRTTTAYLIYTLFTITLLFYIIRTYKRHIKLQTSLKYEQKRIEDIEKLNQAKLRFFTNVSHEFRTPLTLIIGQIEVLLQNTSITPTICNRLLSIYKNCLQFKELITELLDFRKQEQGAMTIKVSEHNIVDFINENYLLWQRFAAQQQIQIYFHKTSNVINAWYDARQMQKVMNNLLSNAFKFTPKGGEISILVHRGNQEVIIEVTDNGIGIPPEEISQIFDRFYQTEQTTSLDYAGTGIGLSLTKGIIELHHGTIEVYSEPNEKTTFRICLKNGNEHFSQEQINKQKDDSQNKMEGYLSDIQQELLVKPCTSDCNDAESPKDTKILIVEDNDSLRDMLVNMFEPFYTVVVAKNGKDGLNKVHTEQPDIVLSDIIMPEMSGIELCKEIKNDMETCHIPVVLLTARTATEHNLEGLRAGADDYITKPFNVNILVSRCNNLINNRIVLQEKFSRQPQTKAQILATNPIDKILINNIVEIIEKHIDNINFSVDDLAKEMSIARTKLFTKMKAITGQTPNDFILTIRLKRATLLLKKHPELNISEVADRVGFNNTRYFSRIFKEKYHVAPRDYRNGDNVTDENEEMK
jgi:signal transduction histidine kinase/ligand-binding sensor domain-containing protein/DNA-binding response OmpR family regulator